jgi:heparanase 1
MDEAAGEVGEVAPEPVPAGPVVTVTLDTTLAVATVDPRFLSVAVDTSQVVGGHWWSEADTTGTVGKELATPFDFSRPRLARLARALAPALLRIGGSEADVVEYDLSSAPPALATAPFQFRFTRAEWDTIDAFARAVGFDLFFTLNAGPGCRDADEQWLPSCVRPWVEHAVGLGSPVRVWELGNEINAFLAIHGAGNVVSGKQYAADLAALRALLDQVDPATPAGGPSSAFWPVVGEMAPVLAKFLGAGGGTSLGVLTWHYYPQQSDRCVAAVRRAEPYTMLDPAALAEVDRWAGQVEGLRDQYAPGVPVWLGETGHAQCGGQRGVSDRFVSSFWWLDELGRMARRGQPVVVRQALSGGDYGLMDDATLTPRSDYWVSVLWKRLMGTTVLGAVVDEPLVPAYAHCTAAAAAAPPGSMTVVLLNLDREAARTVVLADVPGPLEVYLVDAADLLSPTIRLNGVELEVAPDGTLPGLSPVELARAAGQAWVRLPPASLAFVQVPAAAAPACPAPAP